MTEPKFTFGKFPNDKKSIELAKQRKQKIIQMHNSGSSFDEISKVFGISKSRASRIYRDSMKKSLLKPKNVKVASFVRQVVKTYLPYIVLRDGHYLKINYPLLFLILASKKDYFASKKARTYVRLIVHTLKPEILFVYNKLLVRFGEKNLADQWTWTKSDSASVPSCFWNNPELERFLLQCDSLGSSKNFSRETIEEVMQVINNSLQNSPSFDVPQSEMLGVVHQPSSPSIDSEESKSLLVEIKELQGYIEILKSDPSLKREDYISVLDTAIACLSKVESLCSSSTSKEVVQVQRVEESSENKPKVKPKAFWPKPKV